MRGSSPSAQKIPAFNRPPDFNHAGIFWAEGVVGTMAFTFLNQGFIMRYLAAKSVAEGRKCLCFNTLILMPISAIVVGCVGWVGASMLTKGLLPEGVVTMPGRSQVTVVVSL